MKMFSATVSSRKQQQLLIDRGDARALRLERAGERHLLAVDADAALVGRVHAGDDLDQRRLAGAVLAQQRMHLAGPHVEAYGLERLHAGKGFADVGELEDERRAGAGAMRGSSAGAFLLHYSCPPGQARRGQYGR